MIHVPGKGIVPEPDMSIYLVPNYPNRGVDGQHQSMIRCACSCLRNSSREWRLSSIPGLVRQHACPEFIVTWRSAGRKGVRGVQCDTWDGRCPPSAITRWALILQGWSRGWHYTGDSDDETPDHLETVKGVGGRASGRGERRGRATTAKIKTRGGTQSRSARPHPCDSHFAQDGFNSTLR